MTLQRNTTFNLALVYSFIIIIILISIPLFIQLTVYTKLAAQNLQMAVYHSSKEEVVKVWLINIKVL